MELYLKDCFYAQTYTIGKLYFGEQYICDTLEDKCREKNNNGLSAAFGAAKIKGKTAIPAGRYEIDLTMSVRFGVVLPILIGVPWFSGVRIHAGNTEFDTDGCVLVGKNTEKGKVLLSRITLKALIKLIKIKISTGEKMYINVIR